MYFAENIKWLRKTNHLTQPEFAKLFGKTFGGVSHWERGERVPPADDLAAIADYFGITVNELLFSDLSDPYFYNVQKLYEQELLEMFRQLTTEQQAMILDVVKRLMEGLVK